MIFSQLALGFFLAMFAAICLGSNPKLPKEIAAIVDESEPLSGGKVLRKPMAALSAAEIKTYSDRLRQLNIFRENERSKSQCRSVTVFCKTDVNDAYIGGMAAYTKSPIPQKDALGGLRLSLIQTSDSEFSKLSFLGYVPEGVNAAPWSWVSRVFTSKTGDIAILQEWDFAADGGGVLVIEEFLNAKIGPYDASAMLNISKDGRKMWHATWTEPRKQMDLYYLCSIDCMTQSGFLNMANSLYKAQSR